MKPSLFVIALIVVLAGAFVALKTANANPSVIIRNNTSSATTFATALATTTKTWMTAGNATTTIVLNGNISSNTLPDTVSLKLMRLAAGGNTKTKIDIQFSSNCDATSPDWYTYSASTTNAFSTVWTFSASTTIGSDNVVNDYDSLIFSVPVVERCVRAVLTVPAGAASSSLYAEFVGLKQNN